jgi:pyruvate/2-oxoglutarate dehydrogenase complex dihydrolipoamide dehydrogenase (E3) component
LKQVTQIQGVVTQANYISDQQIWKVQYGTQTLSTKKLIIAPGGEPKALDLPMSSIPLEIAIDQTRLQHYVKPGDKALVFGTLHSGTLVIRNLAAIGADVTAFYNSPLPFYWSRDGAYDGIKEEAAQIADDIVAGKIAVKLVSNKDTSAVIRASSGAKWVTYAMGFQPRLVDIRIDGTPRSPTEYNATTGKMYYGAWGFGIAYPNVAPDGIHRDVSVAAFLEHMKRQISEIAQA